ncbi:MAG: CHAT domain-containing protein [Woeseiaceae bacterium]|nr:CHAT domain-containing protein [Woeseiaceae bacterium]
MEYKDFNIRIVSKRDDGYEVVVDSPAGSANAVIQLPFSIEEALKRINDIGGVIRGGNGGGTREVSFESEDVMSPAELGAELYEALFSGAVGKMYYASYGQLANDPEMGLRIKLHLNLEDPEVSELAQIPWEYVYEKDQRDYLALSRQTPIVRYIEVQRAHRTHQLEDDLKILVLMSNPKGVATLDLEQERRKIEESWAGAENISVNFLEHATRENLLEALVETRYHVLHYMGHGAYDEATGAGALILEDEEQNATMLDPDTLGAYLRDAPSVRLVFLNACDTARSDEDEPFAGVANRLVMAGVPAVVAMQFPITDDAAIDFSRAFYSRLVAGFPVDEATAQGRKAILAGQAGTIEWGTPVLYMRAPDGRLFDAPEDAPEPTPVESPAPSSEPTPAPTPDSEGGSSKLGIVAIGIAGIVAIVAIGAFVISSLESGPNFEWYPEDAAFDVGVAETIQLRIREEDDTFDYYDDGFEIELRAGSDEVLIARTDEQQMWEWTVNVQDLGMQGSEPSLEGTIALEARIREVGSGEIAKILETEFPVTVDAQTLASYNAAITAFSDDSVAAIDAVSAYIEAMGDNGGLYLSSAMRAALDTGAEDAIGELYEAARVAAGNQDVVIAERIQQIQHWRAAVRTTDRLVETQADDELAAMIVTLENRSAALQDAVICTSFRGCDSSITSARTDSQLYVSTVPGDANGLTCQWTGPQTKPCDLNINAWRSLNNQDTYTLEIRNRDGDLLLTRSIDIRN